MTNLSALLDGSELRKAQAALICEYGNLGWTWDDRCEMRGQCTACKERALLVMPDKPRSSIDYFAQGIEAAKPPRREAGSARKGESPVPAGDVPK